MLAIGIVLLIVAADLACLRPAPVAAESPTPTGQHDELVNVDLPAGEKFYSYSAMLGGADIVTRPMGENDQPETHMIYWLSGNDPRLTGRKVVIHESRLPSPLATPTTPVKGP